MQEIFEVSLRAWQDAFSLGKIAKAQLQQLACDLGHRFLAQRRLTYDAAFAHLPFPHLELRLDQHQHIRRPFKQRRQHGKNQRCRDERDMAIR